MRLQNSLYSLLHSWLSIPPTRLTISSLKPKFSRESDIYSGLDCKTDETFSANSCTADRNRMYNRNKMCVSERITFDKLFYALNFLPLFILSSHYLVIFGENIILWRPAKWKCFKSVSTLLFAEGEDIFLFY